MLGNIIILGSIIALALIVWRIHRRQERHIHHVLSSDHTLQPVKRRPF